MVWIKTGRRDSASKVHTSIDQPLRSERDIAQLAVMFQRLHRNSLIEQEASDNGQTSSIKDTNVDFFQHRLLWQ